MKNKKISLKNLVWLIAALIAAPLGRYLTDQYGFWPILLTLAGMILLMILFVIWIESPQKMKTREVRCEYSREVQVPPEFYFSSFYDAEFYHRINKNLLDLDIDRKEVGGHIISTYQTEKGVKTHCIEITKWNHPLELDTKITLESNAGSTTTIHHHRFEKTPKGTFYQVQTRIIYNAGFGKLSFMITSLAVKKSMKKHWDYIIKEIEKEYEMRKNSNMQTMTMT